MSRKCASLGTVRTLQTFRKIEMRIATPTTPPSGLLELGDRRVLLGQCLGRGSIASVYRAVLESANGVRRPVACKVFGILASEEYELVIETLAETVRRAACILHPNVATTYELCDGAIAPQPFILSELVVGTTLRHVLDMAAKRGRRIPLDLALFLGVEIAEGLNAARVAKGADGFNLGITHLDLSARDVLLSWNGEVKISDFELGGARQVASAVRSLSAMARRADTMAPEIARGDGGDTRSDVFSLGIILRELLIGRRFAKDVTDAEALRLARDGFVQPITFEPHLPEDVRRILDRALEVEPQRRFAHSGALAYELRKVALSLGVGDARFFLKSMLEKELAEERSDATVPHELGKRRRRRP